MHRLVVVSRAEVKCASDFSLFKALNTSGSLQLDIIWINFPESIALRFDTYYQEVDGNVRLFAQGNIFLHKADDYLSFLGHREAILRVIKPLFICVKMSLCVLTLFIAINL